MARTQDLLRQADVFDVSDLRRPVSSRSVLSDHVWHLDTDDPGHSAGGVPVAWRRGTERITIPTPDEQRLLVDFQRLGWLTLADPRLAHNKTTSMERFAIESAFLLRFMAKMRLQNFADLTPSLLDAYCAWIAEDLSSREDPRIEDPKWVRKIVSRRLRPLVWIWNARFRLEDAGFAVPPGDPLRGKSPNEIAGHVARLAEQMVSPIPNEAFLRIMNAAAAMITDHAEEVLLAQDIWFRHTGGLGTTSERKAACEELATFTYSAPTGEHLRWPPGLTSEGRLDPAGASRSLSKLIHGVRDAAEIVVLGSVGLRGAEFRAVAGGWSLNPDFPDAIAMERVDDLLELYLLRSRVLKGQVVPAPSDWIVGAALTGLDRVPIGVTALRVIERLMAPWRGLSEDPEARVSLSVRLPSKDLPKSHRQVRRALNATISNDVRRFLRHWVNWSGLPDFSSDLATSDLRTIRETRGGRIQARQLRKNYGQFVMRVDSGLLPVLKEQYKHMRMSTTQGSYTSNDPRITVGANDEHRLAGNRAIAEMLGMTGSVGGRLAELITRHESELVLPRSGEYEAATAERLEQLGISLIPAEHGWCGIAFAPSLSRCNQMSGAAHPLNKRPNERLRSPTVCSGCALFAIDRSTEPYWRRRLRLNEEVWDSAVARGEEHKFTVARDRVAQARSMLKWLEKRETSK